MKTKCKMYMCGGEKEKPEGEIPLGIGYLMAFCNDVEYVKNVDDLKDCDYIGLSSVDYGASEAVDILNRTDIPVIIGGQITLWNGLKEYPFKYIICGEGELPLKDILEGKEPTERQVENIDDLPYPILGSIHKTIPIITSRGCPFKCSFCSSQVYWKKIRYHSAGYVIEQLLYYREKYPHIHDLVIHDDLFTCNISRLREIHNLWLKNSLEDHFIPRGHGRAGMFTDETAKLLKEMGTKTIRFGAESGSDRILKILNKKVTVQDNQDFIDICNKYNIECTACFMYNYPFETEDDKKQTEIFMNKNKGKFRIGGWFHFSRFAGTEFYDGSDLVKEKLSTRN